jgi:hypothetical protein
MKPQRNAKGHFIKQSGCTCHPESPFLWNVNRKPSLMASEEPAWKLKLAAQATEALQARRDRGTSHEFSLPGSAHLHHGKQVNAYSKAGAK